MGEENLVITAGLTIADDIKNLATHFPKRDGIVHCAGIGHGVPTKLLTSAEVERVMNSNFMSVVSLQTEMMHAQETPPSVVFVASAAHQMPAFGNAAYTASKAAIIGYAKCLAL